MNVAQILQSWQDGCLADHEAIMQIIAQPRLSPNFMAQQLEAIAIIAQEQEKIFKSRLRAKFEDFLEDRLCVESVGASLSARVIEVLMAAWDREEIIWQSGQSDFAFIRKG